jgi:hypothetical protein
MEAGWRLGSIDYTFSLHHERQSVFLLYSFYYNNME